MSRIALLACCISLLSGCALWKAIFPPPLPPGVPQGAFKMPGVYGRAAGIALNDFLEQQIKHDESLSPEERQKLAPGSDALNKCLDRPEAYDVYVHFDEKQEIYKVLLLPIAEVCLGKEADALIGGGARYEIDARTYAINRRELLE
jgi:hypothetical protein